MTDKTRKMFTVLSSIFVLLFIIASAVNAYISAPKPDEGSTETPEVTDVREYDEYGRVISISYVDPENNLTNNASGYAVIEREYLSVMSRDYIDRYYDENLRRTCTTSGYYGVKKTYEGDLVVQHTYLDINDQPVRITNGTSAITYTYYPDNKTRTEMYFDEFGNPTTDALGRYGILVESYNEDGRRELVTSIDSNGNPMINSKGYVSMRYSYTESGDIRTTMFLDIDGNPCISGKNMYGILYDGSMTYSLSRNGNIVPTIDTVLVYAPILIIVIGLMISILFCYLPKYPRYILLILYVFFIGFETLLFRESGDQIVRWNLLESYEGFWSTSSVRNNIFDNIWLFIPFGAGLYSITKNKKVIALSLLFPVLIEFIQLITGRGMLETADMLNNILGLLIGVVILKLLKNRTI